MHDQIELLACPACRGALTREEDRHLVCRSCGRIFPVQDGIPVLLVDKALSVPEATRQPAASMEHTC